MKSNEEYLPDLVIAGAPKCGTSSLFFWLASHPGICPSRNKETHFLRDVINKHNRELNVHEHGTEAYEKQFRGCDPDRLKLEATPLYLYENTPIEVLSSLEKNPAIIFLLREPSDRLYSAYRFSRYRRKRTDISFRDFIDPKGSDLKWATHPLEQSRYSKYLDRWIDAFGRDRIKVFLFEEMKKAPQAFMRKVANEIGIDPAYFDEWEPEQRNPSLKIRSKWLHSIGERFQPLIPHKVQRLLLPIYLGFNSQKAPPPSSEELRTKEELWENFQDEREKLKELLPELDLSPWELEERTGH